MICIHKRRRCSNSNLNIRISYFSSNYYFIITPLITYNIFPREISFEIKLTLISIRFCRLDEFLPIYTRNPYPKCRYNEKMGKEIMHNILNQTRFP